jgi:ABC-type transporter Mla MlaB component
MSIVFDAKFSKLNNIQMLHLKGPLNERSGTKLMEAIPKIEGRCIINLAGVTHINSIGAIAWVRFINQLENREITLEECAVDFVIQMNCIHGFTHKAKVTSILAQYFCEECQEDNSKLIKLAAEVDLEDLLRLTHTCGHCGGMMRIGEHPENFIRSLQKAS